MSASSAAASFASVALRGGARMPSVGLGCWKIPKAACADAVFSALAQGYRHLDCAADYGNEKEVGAGIRRALEGGVLKREELWVTSKIWMTYHAKEHVEAALSRTLADLGLEYLDLWLIHFPISLKFVPFETRYPPEWVHDPAAAKPCMVYDNVPLIETFRAMRSLAPARVRHAGVCNMVSFVSRTVPLRVLASPSCPHQPNFPNPTNPLRPQTTGLLADLLRACAREGIEGPEVLQVESHPYLVQEKLMRFCAAQGIAVTAFSPLGAASYVELSMATAADSALVDPAVAAVASRLGVTPAQAVLGWHLRRGISAVPKSSKPERLAENLAAVAAAAKLTDEDVRAISALDKHRRFNDPGVFTQGMNSFAPIFD